MTPIEALDYAEAYMLRGERPRVDLTEVVRVLRVNLEAEPAPSIPMRIPCPGCGELHIDEGEFATKSHHTHSCQGCGLTWRPAVAHTVGVRFLPGFKNEAVPPATTRLAVRGGK